LLASENGRDHQKYSSLFYVNQKGVISSIKGAVNGIEAESAGFYKKESIILTKDEDGGEIGGPVKTYPKLKQVAVIAYTDGSGDQVDAPLSYAHR